MLPSSPQRRLSSHGVLYPYPVEEAAEALHFLRTASLCSVSSVASWGYHRYLMETWINVWIPLNIAGVRCSLAGVHHSCLRVDNSLRGSVRGFGMIALKVCRTLSPGLQCPNFRNGATTDKIFPLSRGHPIEVLTDGDAYLP